jgi:endo-1,4-beta-xylanase
VFSSDTFSTPLAFEHFQCGTDCEQFIRKSQILSRFGVIAHGHNPWLTQSRQTLLTGFHNVSRSTRFETYSITEFPNFVCFNFLITNPWFNHFTMLYALVLSGYAAIPLAAGQSKFLGNIISGSIPANWDSYWNQATSENGCKWGSVQRDSTSTLNWGQCDITYNHCQAKGIPFKYHTFVWGSVENLGEPRFISGYSDQKGALMNFIKNAAVRYKPNLIDVVNEALHAPSSTRNAIGGSGSTGWDWIVFSFEQARSLFGNSKLLINEFGIVNDASAVQRYLGIINILKGKNLIDGIGIQCHQFNVNTLAAATITSNVNNLGATGLPVYSSELDINGNSEADQASIYQRVFPALWTNPHIKGITMWGYITGQTWKDGTGIVDAGGHERQAMTWLKSYLEANKV